MYTRTIFSSSNNYLFFLTILIIILFNFSPIFTQGSINDNVCTDSSLLVSNSTEICIRLSISPAVTNGTYMTLEIGNLPTDGIEAASLKMSGPGGWNWEISSLTAGSHSPLSNSPGKNVELEVTSPLININIDHGVAGINEEWFITLMNLGTSGNTEGSLKNVGQFTDIYLKPEVNVGSDFTILEGASQTINAALVNPHRHFNIAAKTWDDGISYTWSPSYFDPLNSLNTTFHAPIIVSTETIITGILNADAGLLNASDALAITVKKDVTPPSAPGTPVDDGIFSSSTSFTFKWSPAVDLESRIIEYYLQVATDASNMDATSIAPEPLRVTKPETTITVQDYQAKTLFARVKAKNGAALEGDWSGISDGITIDRTSPAKPGVPKTRDVLFTSSTGVTYTWDPAEDAQSGIVDYRLLVGTNINDLENSAIYNDWIGSNNTTKTVIGAHNQTLYARVMAKNGSLLEGDWSEISQPIKIDTTDPSKPDKPSANGTYSKSTLVTFSWNLSDDPESGISSYHLQVGTTPGNNDIFDSDKVIETTASVTGSHGQTLFARVRAINGAKSYGQWSDISEGIFILISSVDVAIVIDHSGSMGWPYIEAPFGHIAPAKEAANQFIDFMQIKDGVAVVSFNQSASTNFPFTIIEDENIKKIVKAEINKLYTSGSTSIGAGLMRAQNELLKRGNIKIPQYIILLSDGMENTRPMWAEIKQGILPHIRIYTISLGLSYLDIRLLNESIAFSTNGRWIDSPSVSDLKAIFNSIYAEIMDEQIIAMSSSNISQSEVKSEKVYVDGSTIRAKFRIAWPGSDIELILVAPNGREINPSIALLDPNIEFISGETFESYTINKPFPGEWELKIIGKQIPSQSELYNTFVTAIAELNMNASFSQKSFLPKEPILILAEIKDGEIPVTGAKVVAEVQTPVIELSRLASYAIPATKQKIENEEEGENLPNLYRAVTGKALVDRAGTVYFTNNLINLLDDGLHGDGAANDGIYAAFYEDNSVPGAYTFRINASGVSPTSGGFTRKSIRSVIITPMIDAEYMENRDPRYGSPCEDGWRLTHQDQPIYKDTPFLRDGDYYFVVKAKAEIAGHAAPWMKIELGDLFKGCCEVNSTEWKDYCFIIRDIPTGTHQLKVTFLNDFWNKYQGDRNLLLDKIEIEQNRGKQVQTSFEFEAENMKESYIDNFQSGDYMVLHKPYSYLLHEFYFQQPELTFIIYAKGDSIKGSWPQMDFQLDGQTKASFWVNSDIPQQYSVQLRDITHGKHQIKMRYNYNSYTYQRKLYIDKMEIINSKGDLLKPKPEIETDENLNISLPETFRLEQNFPNPFNPDTQIKYQLPIDTHVTIRVFNTLGQEIKLLVDEDKRAGFYTLNWNGRNNMGNPVSAGVYLYTIQAEKYFDIKKMIILK